MDLWVRSQDRLDLMKTTYICVVGCCIEVSGAERTLTFGYYKSEKRALEVLDEIQGKITQNECLKTMIPKLNNVKGEEEKIGKLFKEMVYEMPKE